MGITHKVSTPITNVEVTIPAVANSTGSGAAGALEYVDSSIVVAASDSIGSTYRFVAVPTTAKIKRVRLTSQAQTAGKFDVGVYYPLIGPSAKADLVANAVDADFFATAVDCASAVQPTDITNESGTYTADKWTQPLWAAVGLSSDPGGVFHIGASVITTDVTTGTGILGLSVEFVQ
jgi:hypothetical protein